MTTISVIFSFTIVMSSTFVFAENSDDVGESFESYNIEFTSDPISSEFKPWYSGINLQKNDFFEFTACYVGYEDCKSFEFHIWIQDETETTWISKITVIVDGIKVREEIMEVYKNNLLPLNVDRGRNTDVFIDFYLYGIAWLGTVSSADDPKDLNDSYFSRLGDIGHAFVSTRISQYTPLVYVNSDVYSLTASPANVTMIHVVENLPFPVMGNIHADGIPEKWFLTKFEMINYGNTGNIENILSPLKQQRMGIPPEDVKCKENFVLIFKPINDSSICVTVKTAESLTQRGWTFNN